MISGLAKQGSIADRIALRAITNFIKEEHLPVTKKQISINRGIDERTARRWRAKQSVSKEVASGIRARHSRANNARVISDKDIA